jgi:alpha-beta hydrolase superfamily lysophospholipase
VPDLTNRTYPLGGIELAGDEFPAESPVGLAFLLHGGGQTRHSWKETADSLAAEGWTSVTLDARGDPAFLRPLSGPAAPRLDTGERLRSAARAVTVPTLLVRGRQSDVLTAEGAEEFLRLVPGARFVDVGGAGHMVAGDDNDVFTRAVLAFLNELA